MKRKLFLNGMVAALSVSAVLLLFYQSRNQSVITPESYHSWKIANQEGDASRKPSEWFTLSRAFPYDDIPFTAYKRALERISELKNSSAGLEIGIWQESGPSNVGGRITTLAVHPDYPDIIYAGAALGGVFKSTNSGINWIPVSDQVPSLSVGDLAIDPSDHNTLYLGTGEANSSGDSYAGTGVYKTTNGGALWQFIGLPESRHIGRIVVDPTDNQRVYVAAMGTLFGTNPDRGVYRSTDGGGSWQRVLFVNDTTGAADIAINPDNPDIIYAAMWQRYRNPRYRQVGGYGSGIWRSIDGGDTWSRLSNGLPAPSQNTGRIGLAVSPANSNYVYACYVNHPGDLIGFWRSTDGGDSWSSRLQSPGPSNFSGFGWYFGRIWAHPTNYNTVYFGDVGFWKSVDGGAHWSDYTGSMHVDMHALFQNPNNPNFMVNGNDGGIFISQNGGNSWAKSYDLPITQFYAITIDKLTPERLYGGTQDNSTPRTLTGIPNTWDVIFYGDGFYCNIDYTNSDIIYAEAQNGYLGKSTNLGQSWDLIRNGIDLNERRNWSTPVVMSPLNNQVLFYGAQRLYKTTNGGSWWNAISPDLTAGGDPGNLNLGTITTIDQSPLSPDIIWAGTDDSQVWVTTDGGVGWNLVSGNLPERWCTRVTADCFDSSTAYVAFSGYKIDELLPHIFKTTDLGVSWTDISGNLVDIPINDILPDPDHQGRLYAASDFGVYFSRDYGLSWHILGDNHPDCSVFDIDLHRDSRKLVSGTHGRSMYTYDLYQLDQAGCSYVAGDANGDGVVQGFDVVFLVTYLKYGIEPPILCECGAAGTLFAGADVNGTCAVNGLDVTFMVNYFKGGPELTFCADCPPEN